MNSFAELDLYMTQPENSDQIISLMLISTECLKNITPESLQKLQIQYQTNLIITAFEDPLKPLKKTETWPIENIIYKPFDIAILQEHIRFALLRNEKVKTIAVHSSLEKNNIEKIRPYHLLQLSDFGFTIETTTNHTLNTAYKFYHLCFANEKKTSLWGKAISKTPVKSEIKNQLIYEFIFCAPSHTVLTNLRHKMNESKSKNKNIAWHGFEKNISVTEPQIYIQTNASEDFDRLKDYFARKFRSAHVFQLSEIAQKEKLSCDLLICENQFSVNQLDTLFKVSPLCFRISNDIFKTRAEATEILVTETIRLQKPIDRNYLGRMMNSYFPSCIESDPNPVNWFQLSDPVLYSELIEVSELSEAAFTYTRDSLLKHGDYQEFAFSEVDENELRPIKAKVQFASPTPDAEKKYAHQVVFFGIRDDILKKLRLWMLQNHIEHKKSET